MKEYSFEDGEDVNPAGLRAEKMLLKDYKKAHASLVIPCHDVFINYKGGILLLERDNFPMKGLAPVGGRLERGIPTLDSLRKKVREECNLELENIQELGYTRTFLKTDPFGHGKGTDTTVFVYVADGKGEIKLDRLHKGYQIVKKPDFEKIKDSLHPYVQDFLEKALELI